MRAPRRDAFQMRVVEIARPPDDARTVRREMNHVLAGAAAGLQHVAGFTCEKFLQHCPDRSVIAMKGRGVHPAVDFAPPILAEFDHILRHRGTTCFLDWQKASLTAYREPQRSDCQVMAFVLLTPYIRTRNRRKPS